MRTEAVGHPGARGLTEPYSEKHVGAPRFGNTFAGNDESVVFSAWRMGRVFRPCGCMSPWDFTSCGLAVLLPRLVLGPGESSSLEAQTTGQALWPAPFLNSPRLRGGRGGVKRDIFHLPPQLLLGGQGGFRRLPSGAVRRGTRTSSVGPFARRAGGAFGEHNSGDGALIFGAAVFRR